MKVVSIEKCTKSIMLMLGKESTLCYESSACDTVRDFLKARIHIQHFGWSCLLVVNSQSQQIACLYVRWYWLTFEYLQHLKNGVMRTSPTL